VKFTTPTGTVAAATFREMAAFKGWLGDLRVWGFAGRTEVKRKRGGGYLRAAHRP